MFSVLSFHLSGCFDVRALDMLSYLRKVGRPAEADVVFALKGVFLAFLFQSHFENKETALSK